jgi:hypothetical protein
LTIVGTIEKAKARKTVKKTIFIDACNASGCLMNPVAWSPLPTIAIRTINANNPLEMSTCEG